MIEKFATTVCKIEHEIMDLVETLGRNPVECRAVTRKVWEHLLVYVPVESLLDRLHKSCNECAVPGFCHPLITNG